MLFEESMENIITILYFSRTLQRASRKSAVEENLRVWKNIWLIYILSRRHARIAKKLIFSVFPRERERERAGAAGEIISHREKFPWGSIRIAGHGIPSISSEGVLSSTTRTEAAGSPTINSLEPFSQNLQRVGRRPQSSLGKAYVRTCISFSLADICTYQKTN